KETERRLSGERLTRVISGERTWRAAGSMIGVLAVVATVAILDRSSAQTGLVRLFAPYGATAWPARTGVESLMHEVLGDTWVHPRGQALLLKARVTRGQPFHVGARYRLRINGRYGPWQRIVMTHQGKGIHERLVDTSAEAIELYFETEDARTQRQEILLAAPPAVYRAALDVTPPSYAAEWFPSLRADLGTGLDKRAVTDTPSLIGSDVILSLELNKPIPAPGTEEWIRRTLGWDDGEPPSCTVDEREPKRWTLKWRLAGTRRLNLQLVDEYGLRNTEPIAYRIDAVEDRRPGVTIMEPEADEPVLATAVVPLEAEARDDVAVGVMGLEASLAQDEPAAPLWETSEWVHSAAATLATELDLATLDLTEGDIVLVHGTAEDVFELDGLRHPLVRSPARRLRVISELDLARRFRRELGAVRQNAIRIEARQAELEEDVVAAGPQPGVERAQAQIGERIATQREAIDRVLQRMEMNRLNDEQLTGLVQQSGELLDFAGRAANRAVEAIEKRQSEIRAKPGATEREDMGGTHSEVALDTGTAASLQPTGDGVVRDDHTDARPDDFADLDLPEPAAEDRPIVEAQEEVRQELTDLIMLLDRDEDTWVATRRLEELLEAQAELEAETEVVGQRTVGRSREELTPGEQTELDRMARRQADLADQGRQLIDDLRRRADELEEVDPLGASGMRSAAESGERRELSRDMENAAERVAQNQLRTAGAAQEGARSTLQQMLQNIRETSRANAQELLRRLASLIESIERLITVQEMELGALDDAITDGDFSGRDRAMIRLNQNTRTVAEEARSAGQESRRIARLLDRAADSQGAAVAALRAFPVKDDEALAAENHSLELLLQAKDLAEEVELAFEQRELMRQRSELIAAYRVFVERQISVRGDTVKLVDQGQLERRQLIEARGLGRSQEEIRQGLDELAASTREIHEAPVFTHVHDMMDDWSSWVTDALISGEVSVAVTDRQRWIADSIGRLIEALESLISEPDEFAGGRQGGSGSGSGQGRPPLIPPIAELMLLRGMQEQVYNQTQDLDDRGDLEADERRERLEELGEVQHDLLELGREMAEALGNTPLSEPEPTTPEPQDQP
ncbi:MAG: coiled-coil domain-containing protein, partial [Planctomycetota bacterium]